MSKHAREERDRYAIARPDAVMAASAAGCPGLVPVQVLVQSMAQALPLTLLAELQNEAVGLSRLLCRQ